MHKPGSFAYFEQLGYVTNSITKAVKIKVFWATKWNFQREYPYSF